MENKMSKNEMLEVVQKNIKRIEDKNFNVYFYVVDSEGYPNGMLEYIYQNALTLSELGYNVSMLYNENSEENSFIGVGEWLGKKYAELPHKNVNKENVEITASDFLFIPEFSVNIMIQTKETPCKRIMILQNRKTLCEAMPITVNPFNLKIFDCIVPTEGLKEYVEQHFPGMRTYVVRPYVRNVFRSNNKEKRLIINIFAKDRNNANKIIKQFYWRFPIYNWVTFRDLRGMAQENVANSLIDGAATIWIDDDSEFGLPILQALKCKSIVMAKVPNRIQKWMVGEDGDLISPIIWFDDVEKLSDMIAGLIRTWTYDEISPELYDDISKAECDLCSKFASEEQTKDVTESYCKLFEHRMKEFNDVKARIENNTIK